MKYGGTVRQLMFAVDRKWLIVFVGLLIAGCRFDAVSPKTEDKTEIPDQRTANILKAKESVGPFFKPMRVEEGDWLKSFEEPGQTFAEYLNANPTVPTAERRIIYIQPLGKFSASQKRILQLTTDYMKAFFNLPVQLNETKPLDEIPKDFQRRHPREKHQQIKTGYFLGDLLPKMLPADAAAFICFTSYDLYPDENWNYVFGVATLQNRVGVWSMWRFGDPEANPAQYQLVLQRTLKVAMHETGHMFSMLHCTKYECLMSGSNHLGETDRRPLDVCPECMAKIAWAMNYEPADRYRNLARFWREQGGDAIAKEFSEKENAVSKE